MAYPVTSDRRLEVVAQFFNHGRRVAAPFPLPESIYRLGNTEAVLAEPAAGTVFELAAGALEESGVVVASRRLLVGHVLGALGMSVPEFRFLYAEFVRVGEEDDMPPGEARGRHIAMAFRRLIALRNRPR